MRNHVSFHLRPVPSKNIENWRRNSILSVDIFEKKYFLDFGKSPISTPDFQNFIFWIKKYYPKDHYKTIVSGFGPAGCMWQRSELKIGEKWESHGSPPLNKSSTFTPLSISTKLLGAHIDDSLSFDLHVSKTVSSSLLTRNPFPTQHPVAGTLYPDTYVLFPP